MVATDFAAALAAASFASETATIQSFESMLRHAHAASISPPACRTEPEKKPIQFNTELWFKFLEIARLFFYEGEPRRRRTHFWFMFLVLALFLGVIGCSFWCLKVLVMILSFSNCDSYVAILSKGVEKSLISTEIQATASAFILLAVSAGFARRRNIRGKLRQWGILGAILLFMLLVTRVGVLFSYVSAGISNTLHERDENAYYAVLLNYAMLLSCAFPVFALNRFTNVKLARYWQQFLTQLLVKHYLEHKTYYRLDSNSTDTEIDNPDQRMTEDAQFFIEESLSFLLDVLKSIMDLVAFAGVLWAISPQLMLVLIVYTALNSGVAMMFGKRLILINYEQLRREADLRYSCIRVRENAESIAFYDGEQLESDGILNRLQLLMDIVDRRILWDTGVSAFTQSFFFLSRFVPYLAIAPLYFQGKVEFGTIAQSQMAFSMVLHSVDFIIRRIKSISKFAAGIHRLSEFYEVITTVDVTEVPLAAQSAPNDPRRMELSFSVSARARTETGAQVPLQEPVSDLACRWSRKNSSQITRSVSTDGSVAITHMTLLTPTGRTLVRDLNCSISIQSPRAVSTRLLVVGPSGIGKSSLLRAIAGLWSYGTGHLRRPPAAEMMFLPQKPYMPLGNLRSQLIYPRKISEIADQDLTQALSRFNLGDLPSRFPDGYDTVQDWSRVLSLGEQQRIAAARCWLSARMIRVVVLDEATSALPANDEKVLYGLLKELGVGLISVGHRESLVQHHDLILRLQGDGGWELLQPNQYMQTASDDSGKRLLA